MRRLFNIAIAVFIIVLMAGAGSTITWLMVTGTSDLFTPITIAIEFVGFFFVTLFKQSYFVRLFAIVAVIFIISILVKMIFGIRLDFSEKTVNKVAEFDEYDNSEDEQEYKTVMHGKNKDVYSRYRKGDKDYERIMRYDKNGNSSEIKLTESNAKKHKHVLTSTKTTNFRIKNKHTSNFKKKRGIKK